MVKELKEVVAERGDLMLGWSQMRGQRQQPEQQRQWRMWENERKQWDELREAESNGGASEDDGTDDEASLDGIHRHAQRAQQRLRQLADLDKKGREIEERGMRML